MSNQTTCNVHSIYGQDFYFKVKVLKQTKYNDIILVHMY